MSAKKLRHLFFTWRRQIRGRCGCRTAAARPARTLGFDVQEGPVGGRWRGDDFRLRRTRTSSLTAIGRRGSRQRLQWYSVDPYRLPVALTVCEKKILQVLGKSWPQYVCQVFRDSDRIDEDFEGLTEANKA